MPQVQTTELTSNSGNMAGRDPWISSSPIPSLSASLTSSIPSPSSAMPPSIPQNGNGILTSNSVEIQSDAPPNPSAALASGDAPEKQKTPGPFSGSPLSKNPTNAHLKASSPAIDGSSHYAISHSGRPNPVRAMSSSAAQAPFTGFKRHASHSAAIWSHESQSSSTIVGTSPNHNRINEIKVPADDVGVIGGSRSRSGDRSSTLDTVPISLSKGFGYGSFRDGSGRPWEDGGSRSNSFSVGVFERRSPLAQIPDKPSSPFPTFSDTDSPPPSPPMPNTTVNRAHSPPRPLSRSRSQSLATGLRPTLGSGLIPMPMSALKPGASPNSAREGTTSFGFAHRAPIAHAESFDAFRATTRNDRDSVPFPPTWRASSNYSEATHDRLTDSVREALEDVASFDPHHGTAAVDDPAFSHGGLSGASSRRHSISIASGPQARRGFMNGHGFSELPAPSSNNTWTRGRGFADEDFLNDRFTSALNLQLEDRLRLQAAREYQQTVSHPAYLTGPAPNSVQSSSAFPTAPDARFLPNGGSVGQPIGSALLNTESGPFGPQSMRQRDGLMQRPVNMAYSQQNTMPAYSGGLAHPLPVRSPYTPSTQPGTSQPQPSANHTALNELGKGVPLSLISSDTPLYIVEFKAKRTDLFFCTDRNLRIDVGDYVIVEADRGQDLGRVTNNTITLEEVNHFASFRKQELAALTAGLQPMQKVSGTFARLHDGLNMLAQQQAGGPLDADDMPGGMQQSAAIKGLSKEITPKRIFYKAGAAEAQLIALKEQDERQALELCRAKVAQRNWPMEVLDAEYQWDRRKLTFYFLADKRIDFRDLVKDLFRIHKTRIWMACLGGLYLEPGTHPAAQARNPHGYLQHPHSAPPMPPYIGMAPGMPPAHGSGTGVMGLQRA